MHFKKLFFISILLFSNFLFINCGNSETENKTAVNDSKNVKPNNTVSNSTATSSANTFQTTKTPEAATVNQGQTIAPIVQSYYEALNKKDEAGVKKYLSQAALKYWETEAKAEKKTWFAFLLESENPIADKREVRNEKIEGETAVVELKGGNLGVWTKILFVKENGEWKFDSPEKSFKLEEINPNYSKPAK